MDSKNRVRRAFVFVALLVIIVWAVRGTELHFSYLLDINKTFHFIATEWFPPDWSVWKDALSQASITLQIAIVGTFFAVLIALPLSFIAARNITTLGISGITRTLLGFLRSVPEIVWGLVFVPMIGLGPAAGVLAIFIHNIGVLGKLIAELVEASDPEPQEAIIAAGGRKIHAIRFAIIPEILPNIYSQYFYRLEVGIRTSLILGFIGAGGIGNMLFIDFKVFSYKAVSLEVLIIMALVLFIDSLGAWVRKKSM